MYAGYAVWSSWDWEEASAPEDWMMSGCMLQVDSGATEAPPPPWRTPSYRPPEYRNQTVEKQAYQAPVIAVKAEAKTKETPEQVKARKAAEAKLQSESHKRYLQAEQAALFWRMLSAQGFVCIVQPSDTTRRLVCLNGVCAYVNIQPEDLHNPALAAQQTALHLLHLFSTTPVSNRPHFNYPNHPTHAHPQR